MPNAVSISRGASSRHKKKSGTAGHGTARPHRRQPDRVATEPEIRRATVPAAGPEEQELLQETYDLLADTVVSIREFCAELRPGAAGLCGPGGGRPVQRDTVRTSHRDQDRSRRPEFTVRCAPDVESGLFRIVQEALLNCAKHSHAKLVRIKLAMQAERLTLAVEDNGIGFDPQALGQRVRGAGMGC